MADSNKNRKILIFVQNWLHTARTAREDYSPFELLTLNLNSNKIFGIYWIHESYLCHSFQEKVPTLEI